MLKRVFNRSIMIPQDHGSWIFILSPLLIGLFAGGEINRISFILILASMSAFLVRQPVSVLVKIISGRRPTSSLSVAVFWTSIYGFLIFSALISLVFSGHWYLILLALPAAPVFAWHLYLVAKRTERKQAGVEILATGVLALAAPAFYWVGKGGYHPLGWMLWFLVWFQSAASIVHAYMRLEQRTLSVDTSRSKLWQMGRRALIYTTFNLGLSLILGLTKFLTAGIVLPYLLQWLETLWGVTHPAIKKKPTMIGIRQLVISTLFTILFIIMWR